MKFFDLKGNEVAIKQVEKAFDYEIIEGNNFFNNKKHEIELLNLDTKYNIIFSECFFAKYLCTDSLNRHIDYAAESYILYYSVEKVLIIIRRCLVQFFFFFIFFVIFGFCHIQDNIHIYSVVNVLQI